MGDRGDSRRRRPAGRKRRHRRRGPRSADAAWAWQTGRDRTAPYAAVVVVADQLSDVPGVRADIAAIGYTSSAAEGLIVSISRYIHVVEIVLSGIGFVALVIAALGIANALFASVRERRHEIGILKAIGARDNDVLRIFLAEASAIGLVGGLLGTIAGIGIALVIGERGELVPLGAGSCRRQPVDTVDPPARRRGGLGRRGPARRTSRRRSCGPPSCTRGGGKVRGSRPRGISVRNVAAVLLVAVCAAACGGGPGTFAASHVPKGAVTLMVAVGGDESAGSAVSDPEHDDWPQLFYRQALSQRSTLYDLASPDGVRVEDLLGGEVGAGVGAPASGRDPLGRVGRSARRHGPCNVRPVPGAGSFALRSRGATVLVANLLPVYRFPGYATCRAQPISCGISAISLPPPDSSPVRLPRYDSAISGAASAGHASVVDVTGIFAARSAKGSGGLSTLVDASDLGLTAAGEQVVAAGFERAYSASGR